MQAQHCNVCYEREHALQHQADPDGSVYHPSNTWTLTESETCDTESVSWEVCCPTDFIHNPLCADGVQPDFPQHFVGHGFVRPGEVAASVWLLPVIQTTSIADNQSVCDMIQTARGRS